MERLYAARDGEQLNSFADDLKRHGVPQFWSFSSGDVLLRRLPEAVAKSQPDTPFIMLPVDLLTGPNGLWTELRRQGARISVLA